MPNGFGLEWDGDVVSGAEAFRAQAPALYAISLLVVFLCLAASYESWSVPFSVMLVVPLGVIVRCWQPGCAGWKTTSLPGGPVNGHRFIGQTPSLDFVQFANEMNQKGHDLFEATLHACRQRLRPILMTSLAFVSLRASPMATSTGAGSGGQHAVELA
ncbi:efflux RND transporter permease subunit [Shigella flexneri]